jgi:hypothetical protein
MDFTDWGYTNTFVDRRTAVRQTTATSSRAGPGAAQNVATWLRALWTEWSVEVRVLSGAREKSRDTGASIFSGTRWLAGDRCAGRRVPPVATDAFRPADGKPAPGLALPPISP